MRSAVITLIIAAVIIVMFVGTLARSAARHIFFPSRQSRSVEMQSSTPTVDSFHAIEVNGAINVVVKQGSATSLTFRGSPEALGRLKEEVANGVLTIGTKDGFWTDNLGTVTATIETPNLDSLTVNGSGETRIEGARGAGLTVEVNGSGDIRLDDVKTGALEVTLNGSSNVTAAGSADKATFAVEGSGDIDARQLAADAVKTSVNGSGEVHVNAAKTLDVQVSGSGDVHYSGHPTITQNIAGSGSVSPG